MKTTIKINKTQKKLTRPNTKLHRKNIYKSAKNSKKYPFNPFLYSRSTYTKRKILIKNTIKAIFILCLFIGSTASIITLFVNAVYPSQNTSKAFSHKVVIRPLADGRFQYVSNEILTPKDYYETWRHSDRLTNSDNTLLEPAKQSSAIDSTDTIFENHCSDCVLSDIEKSALNEQALTAALQVKEIYRNIERNGNSRWESNITNFTMKQCQQVVSLLGNAGYVSVSDDTNMENYQKVSEFYAAYQAQKDADITIYNVNSDGYIGVFTFLYRADKLQTYYVGIGWQSGGIPQIQTTSINDVAELKLTKKGYFIYSYAASIAHASARQYWRITPLSDVCRALTNKYITGLSYVNYNLLVTNWDKSTVESILMPCMFADIYRKDTGKNLQVENTGIPAALFEQIMTTYFPVTIEQLRAVCGYDERTNTYAYEVIYATPFPPFGEVVGFQEHADGTITLTVDGVWPDYNSDCAFTNQIVVQPFSDGTFRFLSNKITRKELEIPQVSTG